MLAQSIGSKRGDGRPGALRDLQRDWKRWSLGERIAMGTVAALSLPLLLIELPGVV
jgi:hypothetical protein